MPNGIKIDNVLYIPDLAVNMLSISAFVSNGLGVLFCLKGRKGTFTDNSLTVMTASQSDSLFLFDAVTADVVSGVPAQAYIAGHHPMPLLWHRCFGHLGYAVSANITCSYKIQDSFTDIILSLIFRGD